ncbi:MAG: hypothetical protein HOV81_15290, partial [Kofleriaceae bacterium]|nr:hypothetical protein [Kofleriaceae bacterium]
FAEGDEDSPEEHHEEHHEAQPEEHQEAQPEEQAEENHEAQPEEQAGEDHEAAPADDDAEPAQADPDEDGEHYSKFDVDGDGTDDAALEQEYEEAMGGIEPEIDPDAVEKELAARPEDAEMKPSITADQFRKIVRVVKKVVLDRMEKKMAKSSAKKMSKFSAGISIFSLLGLLLLFMPLVLARRYPGQGKTLFKYSALAALTFVVTVNLFGGVLFGMKTVQGALGGYTNPSLAIARGTFDTLDRNAEEYITMGKELFVPTLAQLQGNSEEQPSLLILENGKKIVKKAQVFVSVAKTVKKLDFVFKILPIILFGVSMILFALAIRPTLTEIIKLPMRAAAGEAGAGREVTKGALRRVWGELRATLCTLVVLSLLTVVSGFVLGRMVGPALDALLGYFSFAVSYLQFVDTASSTLVFVSLFGVILFLVLNLATLIVSMSFFLGKTQKIFQQRFNHGIPVGGHNGFFKWGVPAVLFVQVFPWLFAVVAAKVILKVNTSLLEGVTDADQVPWGKLMIAGPLLLVVGYLVLFWAARGIKAVRFLQKYKVT